MNRLIFYSYLNEIISNFSFVKPFNNIQKYKLDLSVVSSLVQFEVQ